MPEAATAVAIAAKTGGGTPDFGPSESLELEFEPDAKEQEDHSKVGDRLDRRRGVESERVEREASNQIAH